MHRDEMIEMEGSKTEKLKEQASVEASGSSAENPEIEKPGENLPKSRKKVHLNEELVSPI